MASAPARLRAQSVTKSFPGVRALDDVDIVIGEGEVVAVVGENGAGKSTLMKILAGVQAPDSGLVEVDGEPLQPGSVQRAIGAGVALIHQELNLADNLDVAANVMLGREPRRFGVIDGPALEDAARPALEAVGLDVPPDTPLSELSIGHQQLVEIAKALSVDARVLIMDEPTSSLTTSEVERLFEVVRSLKTRGVSVVYISHRLGEVCTLADRVVVLRDGRNAGVLVGDEIGHGAMVKLMVGRDVSQFYARTAHKPGELALEVRGLRTEVYPAHEIDFDVRRGEIVGIAGLVGAGRTELLETLFGVRPALGGSIRISGAPQFIRSPREALSSGLALVPEDRKQQGLVLDMSVMENISLGTLSSHSTRGLIDRDGERRLGCEMVEQLGIRTPGIDQPVRFLSGGNQQKVVIGRWLAIGPGVLLLDEPTRGVDIGAKEEIYKLIESFVREGMAVLFVSSEMEEVLGLADRVAVMHEGRLTGILDRSELTEEAVMRLATATRETSA